MQAVQVSKTAEQRFTLSAAALM